MNDKNTPEPQEKNGRTWPDLLAALPVWLIALSLLSFAGLSIYASFIKREKVAFGFLGEFGPVSSNKAVLFPEGAIIAFDRDVNTESACPTGWKIFSQAGGRFIVGAGQHSNLDSDNNPLSEYNVGDLGGKERVILAEGNLPQHQHPTQVGVLAGNDLWGNAGENDTAVQGARVGRAFLANSGFAGYVTPTPVEIRPPFIPLFFCKLE